MRYLLARRASRLVALHADANGKFHAALFAALALAIALGTMKSLPQRQHAASPRALARDLEVRSAGISRASGSGLVSRQATDLLEVPSAQILRRRIIDVFGNGYFTFMAIIQGATFAIVFVSAQQQISAHLGLTHGAIAVVQTIGALLAIVIVSHEYLLLTVVVVWTPTVFDVIIPFLVGSGECWVALSIGHYRSWWIALSALCSAGALALWHTLARTTEEIFGDRKLIYRQYCKAIGKQIFICMSLAITGAVVFLLNSFNMCPPALNLMLISLVNVTGVGIICLREHDQNRIYDEYGVPRCHYSSLPGRCPLRARGRWSVWRSRRRRHSSR